jgi:hypothetical protein
MQTGLVAHPAFYPSVLGPLSLGVKQQECEVGHSPPSNAKVKNGGAIPSLPYMSSWHSATLINHRGNFTFLYIISLLNNMIKMDPLFIV